MLYRIIRTFITILLTLKRDILLIIKDYDINTSRYIILYSSEHFQEHYLNLSLVFISESDSDYCSKTIARNQMGEVF
jgi:hypothetical protein